MGWTSLRAQDAQAHLEQILLREWFSNSNLKSVFPRLVLSSVDAGMLHLYLLFLAKKEAAFAWPLTGEHTHSRAMNIAA